MLKQVPHLFNVAIGFYLFLNSLNHFRAISIVFIIAGHSLFIQNSVPTVLMNIVLGGTSLFVFISGFLFHHVFYPKFAYQSFMLKKCKNVLIPYLIMGLIPIINMVFFINKAYIHPFFQPSADTFIANYVTPIIQYYATGAKIFVGYWYIPFIMLTFALAPLHVKFIHLGLRMQLTVILILTVAAVLIHRPIDNLNVWQSVIYFAPLYLIGIASSIYKETVYRFLNNKDAYLLALVLLFSFLEFLTGHYANYHKPPFVYAGVDLMFFQKLFLCFFFLIFLKRFEHLNNKFLHLIAATSFASFFIHPCVLLVIRKLDLKHKLFGSSVSAFEDVFIWTAVIIIALSASVAIAVLLKKLLPQHSRYITGY